MSDHELLFSFPDASASFVHGFEAGRLYAYMEMGLFRIESGMPVHRQNTEVIRRMADECDYEVSLEACEDGNWAYLEADRKERAMKSTRLN